MGNDHVHLYCPADALYFYDWNSVLKTIGINPDDVDNIRLVNDIIEQEVYRLDAQDNVILHKDYPSIDKDTLIAMLNAGKRSRFQAKEPVMPEQVVVQPTMEVGILKVFKNHFCLSQR
jgi:hypothetical protein